ncbi:putative uncharacterized protein C8orf89 homolog [Eublepharis macularius]|uniref:Uncharacterized protein n=1 Tax=Eublepharis macularius TaxID=481883 RepID=A0AA97L4D2_EUBMA|nr:putative uncharacterized protein C8orf89 homolog [Eublepharis macularius]
MPPAVLRSGEGCGGGGGFSGASDRPLLFPKRGGGGTAMSKSPQRTRLEQRESQVHNDKLPGISCLPESQPIVSRLSKEQKLPVLTSDHKYLDNKVLRKPFWSHPLESSWKNAVIKTKKMKQEYTSAYGLKETSENAAMPSLAQGSERYLAVSNSSPVVQKTEGAANSFPVSSCINEDYNCLPPLYLLPSTSSQYFDGFYKSRGDTAIDNIVRREMSSWKPDSLKAHGVDGGAGEVGAVRLKKYNQCSSLISFSEGSKFKPGKCIILVKSHILPPVLVRMQNFKCSLV